MALAAARNGRVTVASAAPNAQRQAQPLLRRAAPRRRAASTCSASLRAQLPRRGRRAAAGQRATPAGPSTCLPPPATLAALLRARQQQRRGHGRHTAVERSTSTPIKELTGAHLPSRSHPTPAPRVTRPDARRRRRADRARIWVRRGPGNQRSGGPKSTRKPGAPEVETRKPGRWFP